MSHDGADRRLTPLTDEQLRLIGKETERAATKALRRYVRRASVAFVALLIGLAFAGKAYLNVMHDGLVGSCHRVNVLRAQSNSSDLVSFRILSASGQREAALTKGDKANAPLHERNAKQLRSQAVGLTVTALTNCEQAVGNPKHYSAPVATPIGNPTTGKLSPGIAQIEHASRAILVSEQVRARG